MQTQQARPSLLPPSSASYVFEQCRAFLGEAKKTSSYHTLYHFMLTTGCRAGEVPVTRGHDMRHSTASYLNALGVDPFTISRILGHHSAAFTITRYIHSADKQAMRDGISRLENLAE